MSWPIDSARAHVPRNGRSGRKSHGFGRKISRAASTKYCRPPNWRLLGTPARAGDVRRSHRRAPHHCWGPSACQPEQRAGAISADILACGLGLPARPIARPSQDWNPDAGDDGRDLRLGGADARASSQRPKKQAARISGLRRRRCSPSTVPSSAPESRRYLAAPVMSLPDPLASGRVVTGLDHSGHRRVPDEDRRRLGGGATYGSECRGGGVQPAARS